MKKLMSTLFVIAAAAGMALAADKPDFSGDWKMDADKSVFGPMPPPTSMTRKIDHKDPEISVDRGAKRSPRRHEHHDEILHRRQGNHQQPDG